MTTNNLKPCENCNWIYPRMCKVGIDNKIGYKVECPRCGWCTAAYRKEWKAIRKWDKLHFGDKKEAEFKV